MRVRFSARSMLALISLTAILLAIPGELSRRQERRHFARIKVCHQDWAAIHERHRAKCVASAGRVAYDATSRQWALMEDAASYVLPTFDGWEAEADWHARRVKDCLAGAATYEQLEQSARRRLILPVIFDVRSGRR